MKIFMTGINYSNADITYREKVSLNNEKQQYICKKLQESKLAEGSVIVSTCNRTELWISGGDISAIEFFINEVLADLEIEKDIINEVKKCFVVRSGEEAIDYLLELACGIHSQIFGEDQILTQLKTAVEFSRENGYIDSILESLFRTVITAAKKVKTEVVLTNKNRSLPETIVSYLEANFNETLKDKNCLVIGNGEMGRLMASHLILKGAKVDMTLRQYKKKQAIIPSGCGVVLYEERYNHIEKLDYIFSATKSPHYTMKADELASIIDNGKKYCFIDMALPRDIDPELKKAKNIELLHIDDFGVKSECSEESLNLAKEILLEYKNDFISWYNTRIWAPKVNEISEAVGELTDSKLTKVYKSINISGDEKELLQASVQAAAKKAVSKIIFSLRENMENEDYNELLQVLEFTAKNSI